MNNSPSSNRMLLPPSSPSSKRAVSQLKRKVEFEATLLFLKVHRSCPGRGGSLQRVRRLSVGIRLLSCLWSRQWLGLDFQLCFASHYLRRCSCILLTRSALCSSSWLSPAWSVNLPVDLPFVSVALQVCAFYPWVGIHRKSFCPQ